MDNSYFDVLYTHRRAVIISFFIILIFYLARATTVALSNI